MKNLIGLALLLFGLFACSSSKNVAKSQKHTLLDEHTFKITELSTDPDYGFSPKKPVEVGSEGSGPKNELRYLNALSGPNGEVLSYFRKGSCCPIKSDQALIGNHVLIDNYRLTWEGSGDTVSIYINMYDSGELKAPKGFGIKNH